MEVKVHHWVHNSQPLFPVIIPFNIIFPSTCESSTWSRSFSFPSCRWKLEVPYHDHNSQPLVPVIIPFNIIFPSTCESSTWSRSFSFPSCRWKLEVPYHDHNSQPLVPVISHMYAVHAFQSICLRYLLVLYSHLHVSLPSGLVPSGFQAVES